MTRLACPLSQSTQREAQPKPGDAQFQNPFQNLRPDTWLDPDLEASEVHKLLKDGADQIQA